MIAQEPPEPSSLTTQSPPNPLKHERELPKGSLKDKDRLAPLVAEALTGGGCVLVFCGARRQCHVCAALLANELPTLMGPAFQVTVSCCLQMTPGVGVILTVNLDIGCLLLRISKSRSIQIEHMSREALL